MSVDIHVIPTKVNDFSFSDFSELINSCMQSILKSYGFTINTRIILSDPTTKGAATEDIKPEQLRLPMAKTLASDQGGVAYYYRFSDNSTFWCVMYTGIAGEGLADYIQNDVDWLTEDLLLSGKQEISSHIVAQCRKYLEAQNVYWSTSCYGQDHPLNSIAFGAIAAALAALTEGMIVSDDGPWNWDYLPCGSNDFMSAVKQPKYSLLDQQEGRKNYLDELIKNHYSN